MLNRQKNLACPKLVYWKLLPPVLYIKGFMRAMRLRYTIYSMCRVTKQNNELNTAWTLILWFDMTSSRFTWYLRMISFINERIDGKKQIEIGGAGTGGCRGGTDVGRRG